MLKESSSVNCPVCLFALNSFIHLGQRKQLPKKMSKKYLKKKRNITTFGKRKKLVEEIEKMIEIHLWKIKIITFSPDSYITCGRL